MSDSLKDYDDSFFTDSRKIPSVSNTEDYDDSFFQPVSKKQEELSQEELTEEFIARDQPVIPPVGIAKPELVSKSLELIENPEELREYINADKSYQDESPWETVKREALSHTIRAGEGLLGGINSFLNLLTPELYENEEGMPYGPGEQKEGLPSANQLHEITKEKTGEYLEPKEEFTKTSQEIVSDIGSMFSTPGLGFMQKLLLPVGGQVVKQIVKGVGGGETSQDIGKLGFMTIASIANLGNAPKVASQAMSDARNMIPNGVRFSAKPTEQALKKVMNSSWFKTGRTPSKGPAMDEIKRVQDRIINGTIDAHDAMQLRVDINEARKQLGAFNIANPVTDKKSALKYLSEVDDALIQSMDSYGKNVNPKWLESYKLANEAYRITARSRGISDFIQKTAKPLKSETAKILYHIGGATALTKLPTIAAAAVPISSAAKLIQVTNRMIRSQVLRNHYLDVLKQASLGNAAATSKALQKFDITAKKLEEKQKAMDKKYRLSESINM